MALSKLFFYHYFIYFSPLSKMKFTSQTTACLFLQGLQLLQVKTQVNSENYFVNVCSDAAETETDYLLLEAFLFFFFFFLRASSLCFYDGFIYCLGVMICTSEDCSRHVPRFNPALISVSTSPKVEKHPIELNPIFLYPR